jgi:uncharacterized protein YktB (UPF0637 family)
MAFTGFTDADYNVFDIPAFAERMAAIRGQVRPKLLEIGEELSETLRPVFGPDFHPHVASHMRRRVNPPPDTWVAFGPSRKGYKAYPHLSVGIGFDGPYVEFIVMNESPGYKAVLSNGLKRNAEPLAAVLSGLTDMTVHLDHHAPTSGQPASSLTADELCRLADEVVRLKGNEFMIARPYRRNDPQVSGRTLLQTAEAVFRTLQPFYRCAVEPDVRLD